MNNQHSFLTWAETGKAHQEECFLGALIGGAVSLVGGLMGRSDAKKRDKAAAKAAKVPVITDTSHTVDLSGMNAAAIAAGYNPMTILNAGGLSAFTKTHTETTGQNAMAAVPTAPSFGSVLANAASTAFNTYREDKAAAAQAAQTAALTSSFAAAPSMARTLGLTAGGGRAGGNGLQFGAAPVLTAKAGMPYTPSVEQPTLTNPHPNAMIDSITRDASAYEERYGDVAGSAAGIWILYQDALMNLTGMNQKERHNWYGQKVQQGVNAVQRAYGAAQAAYATAGGPGLWDRARENLAKEGQFWNDTLKGGKLTSGGGGW